MKKNPTKKKLIPDRCLSLKEVSTILHLSDKEIEVWIVQGDLRTVEYQGRKWEREAELNDFLDRVRRSDKSLLIAMKGAIKPIR